MITLNIISRGVCICLKEGNRDEGYCVGDKYQFERRNIEERHYVCVFNVPLAPDIESPVDFTPPFMYDMFSESKFQYNFKVVLEKNV